MHRIVTISALLLLTIGATSCAPKSRVNNTIGGTVVGGLWGAGAGAVIGNQITPSSGIGDRAGDGAAVGVGLGMISGAMQGAGFDATENELDDQKETLFDLQIKNQANRQLISNIQAKLDNQSQAEVEGLVYQVFFETDATNLKLGAVKNLEQVADQLIKSSRLKSVMVKGHSDETGSKDYNQKLAGARANSVVAYLMGRGLSQDQIITKSYGATQPVASNRTAEGRQLNRRVDISIQTN